MYTKGHCNVTYLFYLLFDTDKNNQTVTDEFIVYKQVKQDSFIFVFVLFLHYKFEVGHLSDSNGSLCCSPLSHLVQPVLTVASIFLLCMLCLSRSYQYRQTRILYPANRAFSCNIWANQRHRKLFSTKTLMLSFVPVSSEIPFANCRPQKVNDDGKVHVRLQNFVKTAKGRKFLACVAKLFFPRKKYYSSLSKGN